jgi:hypothetical protein
MAFEPFSDVRGAPAIIVGNRDLRSLRAVVERHAGGPAAAFVEQLDAEVRILSVTGGGEAVMTKELLVINGSDGTFDVAAAMRAAAAVRAQAGRARVKLDLSRARVEDAALAAFVREVAGRPVAIVGLSRHHERLLRYLDEGAGAEERA